MIRALPDRAKSSTASHFKDEYKTGDVKTEAKGGFASVISEILDDVIDSVPLSRQAPVLLEKLPTLTVLKSIKQFLTALRHAGTARKRYRGETLSWDAAGKMSGDVFISRAMLKLIGVIKCY